MVLFKRFHLSGPWTYVVAPKTQNTPKPLSNRPLYVCLGQLRDNSTNFEFVEQWLLVEQEILRVLIDFTLFVS